MNTMPLEASTRILIDRTLENLGWNFNGKDQNVYLEQPKTEKERKLLKGNRPDYVLYSKESDKPLIVIEAKKPGEKIDKALSQGIDYAKALGAPLVFATDGVFCKSYHTGANKTPILNGEEVDEFIREALALRYLSGYEVNTVSPKVQYDRKELIRVFDEANNMLRGVGLRAGIERFGEFANILFLKLIGENEQAKRERGENSSFDIACSWETIKNIPTTARIDYINNTVFKRLNVLYETEIFTSLTMQDPSILKEIMDKLDPLMLTDVDSDIKGDAFEYFLKASASTKNDLGEYFTPRHIVKTMVRLVNPQIGEKIYDPFCGTGGFLIESFRYIERNMVRDNPTLTKMLRQETIYGNEITNTARITKMNMILAGDGHSNIHMKDSLANPIYVNKMMQTEKGDIARKSDGTLELSDDNYGGYDIVLANMPYSQKTKYGSLYDLPSTNGDSICVQHCIKAVNATAPNGRMALVVPEGFLFRKDLSKAREYLLENCQLQSIISLPQGVFLPYTGVKTNIIFATKVNQKIKSSERKKDFWYFDVKSDGYTLDNHRRKLGKPSDLSHYEEYRKLDSQQTEDMLKVGFEVIPFDKVRANSNILVGSRYRERIITNSKFNFRSLKDICEIIAGQSPESQNYNAAHEGLPFYQGNTNFGDVFINSTDKWTTQITKESIKDDVLLSVRAPVGAVNINTTNICIGRGLMALRCKNEIYHKYLFYILKSAEKELQQLSLGSTFAAVTKSDIENFVIPLPPLEMQEEIVKELESYQQMIFGAKLIVENYEPKISINDEWECFKLNEVCDVRDGTHDSPQYVTDGYPLITSKNVKNGSIDFSNVNYISETDYNDIAKRSKVDIGDIIMPMIGTIGNPVIVDTNELFAIKNVALLKFNNPNVINKFVKLVLMSKDFTEYINRTKRGNTQKFISLFDIREYKIPIPPVEIQQQIVSEIEIEQSLIEPSNKVIEVFIQKIHNRISEIWGDAE